jgi:hypothetical protein
MCAALECGDWKRAHDECLDSDWARKPDQAPRRARRAANGYLTGKWVYN